MLFDVSNEWAKRAYVNREQYQKMYAESIGDPERFWAEQAKCIDWMKPWTKVKNTSFKKPVSIKWFENAKLNISVNCIDRHLPKRAKQTAIIWEADDPKKPSRHITYQELSDEVNRLANTLKARGVKKARLAKYLPHRAGSKTGILHATDTSGARKPKNVVTGGNREASSSNGAGASTGGFRLSSERVQALKDAGMWEDTAARNDMIRRYRDQDRQKGAF